MYRNLKPLIEEIYESAPVSKNISVDDVRTEIEARTGEKVSRSTVYRVMQDLGLVAEPGKKRTWKKKEGE